MSRTVVLSAVAPEQLPGTVLTLNRRAARQFGTRSLRLTELAGRTVQQAGLEVASPALAQRLLTESVRETLQTREPGLTARASTDAVRELLRVGADLGALEKSPSPQVAQLAKLTRHYLVALEKAGVLDQAQMTWRATELARPQLLSLTSYPRLLPDEQHFLDTACADGSVIHLPWANHPYFQENLRAAEFFAGRGWEVEKRHDVLEGLSAAFLGQGGGSGKLHVLTSEKDEIRAALGEVKQMLLSGTPANDIALVVNDDERWASQVDAVAQEYGVPIRFGTSVTASQTRVGRWILRAVQVNEEGFSLESVARLLAHPLEQLLDGGVWRDLRQQAPQNQQEWEAAGISLQGLVWPEQATRREWVLRLLELLDERGIAERSFGTDLLALNFVRAELAVLAQPPADLLSQPQFFEELRDLLGLLAVPTHLSRQGVELLTPPSLLGAAVPHVFFLGMSDGGLPAALQDNPTLDFLERKRLQAAGVPVETAASLSRRNAIIFWGALQAAGQATFSYARLTGSGLPSPYLAPLGLTAQAAPLYASSPEEARRYALRGDTDYFEAALTESRRRYEVETQRLGAPDYSEYDGQGLPAVQLDERVFSASQLSVLGRCGFQWWLQYGLGLADEEASTAAMDLGRLRHEVLRRGILREIEAESSDVRAGLLAHLQEDWLSSEEALEWPQTQEWERQRPEHLAALRQVIEQKDFLRPGASPLAVEQPFTGDWFGFQVRGKVDRLDSLGGKALVLDYKSGASKPAGVQDLQHQLKLDVQLAIYAQAALPQLYPQMGSAGGYYLSLKNGKQLDQYKVNMTEFEALTSRLKDMLNQGKFVPRPDAALKACELCSWAFVCRAGQRLERKEFA